MRLFGRFNDSDAERLRLSAQITELLAQARAGAELPGAYNPEDKFTWREGDIEIKREGTGPPLISQQELDRMLAENKLPDRFYAEEPIDVELPDGTKVKWAEYIAQEEAKRRIKTIHVYIHRS